MDQATIAYGLTWGGNPRHNFRYVFGQPIPHLQSGTHLARMYGEARAMPPAVRMPLVSVILVPHRHRATGCAARPSHCGRASPRNVLL